LGKAPLADPVFVEPGSRVVEARLDGVGVAKVTAAATPGGKVEVKLTLGKAPAEVTGSAGAAGGSAGTGASAKPAAGAGGTGATTPARGASGTTRPNIGIIIGGSAGAGAALITGIALTAVANGKASKARDEASQVKGTCPLPPPTTGPCADLASLFRQRASFSNAAVWSFIGAGALGAATVIYVVATRSAPKAAVRAAPIVTASGGGLTVAGAW